MSRPRRGEIRPRVAAADARGDCLATGDAASVEAIVDEQLRGGGACAVGSCGSNGEFCQTVPSCVCNGPIFCICSATTFTTCTMPICTTTSTVP